MDSESDSYIFNTSGLVASVEKEIRSSSVLGDFKFSPRREGQVFVCLSCQYLSAGETQTSVLYFPHYTLYFPTF